MQISKVFIYPIKSCRGVAVSFATLSPAGLDLDRQWMVVREDGKFVTARQYPIMALVVPTLPEPNSSGEIEDMNGTMLVNAPSMQQLSVPLSAPLSTKGVQGAWRPVTVWEWGGDALDEGEAAAEWFTTLLGFPCRLVRCLLVRCLFVFCIDCVKCVRLRFCVLRRTSPVF